MASVVVRVRSWSGLSCDCRVREVLYPHKARALFGWRLLFVSVRLGREWAHDREVAYQFALERWRLFRGMLFPDEVLDPLFTGDVVMFCGVGSR